MSTLVIPEPYALVAARHGTMLINRNDVYMGQAFLAYGECCEIESQFLGELLRLPGLVIEAGANRGIHTIPMAMELARQGRRLMAFEPQRIIFQQLCANLALNGLMNVTALPYRIDKSPLLIEWLFDHSYRLWWHIPALYNPANLRGEKTNFYPGVHSLNMICVPNGHPVALNGFEEITDPAFHPLSRARM